jgi:hypothetical protein
LSRANANSASSYQREVLQTSDFEQRGIIMAWEPTIWTGDVRRVLYKRLVKEFGPLDSWEKSNLPGRGLDQRFVEFCDDFAKAIGAKSGEAVQQQIRFAMPESHQGSTWERQVQTAIMNKAAALEMGFIEDKHLPDIVARGRKAVPSLEDI